MKRIIVEGEGVSVILENEEEVAVVNALIEGLCEQMEAVAENGVLKFEDAESAVVSVLDLEGYGILDKVNDQWLIK